MVRGRASAKVATNRDRVNARSFEHQVLEAVRRLEAGEVASYGEIAEEAGFRGAARAVGNVLAKSDGVPWWRVVRSDGTLVASKDEEQARRLRSEGVRVVARETRRGRVWRVA